MNAVQERTLVFIRASSLAELFDCAHRWEGKHLLGMNGPTGGPAQLGTGVHAGTAAFDSSRLPGGTPISIDDAAGAVVDAIHRPEREVDWGDMKQRDAERIALSLHTKYCADIAPKQEYMGVEVKCERLDLPDLGISLTGTNDRVRRTPNGLLGIADLKTGKRAVRTDGKAETAKHALQLGVYELLAQHAMGIPIQAPAQVIGMNTGTTPASQRIGTGEVKNARALLLGQDGEPGFLEQAAVIVRSGVFQANPSSFLCSVKYCTRWNTCRYRAR